MRRCCVRTCLTISIAWGFEPVAIYKLKKVLSTFVNVSQLLDNMSEFKRARWSEPWGQHEEERDEPNTEDDNLWNGKCLQDYLLQLKIMGKLEATHVTKIAYFHRVSGGRGCERIALHPQKDSNLENPLPVNANRIP